MEKKHIIPALIYVSQVGINNAAGAVMLKGKMVKVRHWDKTNPGKTVSCLIIRESESLPASME